MSSLRAYSPPGGPRKLAQVMRPGGEVDEAVVLAGGDEEDVAFDEGDRRVFFSSDPEGAGAFHDDVELGWILARFCLRCGWLSRRGLGE